MSFFQLVVFAWQKLQLKHGNTAFHGGRVGKKKGWRVERLLSALIIWPVIALLLALLTVTKASPEYRREIVPVNGATTTRAKNRLAISSLRITAGPPVSLRLVLWSWGISYPRAFSIARKKG
jgi:hypothetical protein